MYVHVSGTILQNSGIKAGPRVISATASIRSSLRLIAFSFEYLVPTVCIGISLPTYNPLYVGILSTLNLTDDNFPLLIKITLCIICFLTANIIIAVYQVILYLNAYGISALYLWTLYISPSDGVLKGTLSFASSFKIYKSLRVMTLILGESARRQVSTCLHHFYAVAFCTISLYYTILQFTSETKVSLLVVSLCLNLILVGFINELFAICFMAKSSTASKGFVREMVEIHGRNPYRRRVLKAILPNSINLEFVNSVKTMQNGIEMDYFLNFLGRITDNTINLLLARE